MSKRSDHLGTEQLQAFLDGDVSKREHRHVEAHIASCRRCAEELESWRVLFDDLAHLDRLAPDRSFHGRVMAGVEIAQPLTWADRLKSLVGSLSPQSTSGHPGGELLQDFVDGALPGRAMARVEAHVAGCTACAEEARGWRDAVETLSALGHFTASEDFADRVMASLTLTTATGRAKAPAKPALWRRGLATVGRLVPRTRRAWAAVGGVALTPAVTVGLVFYAVFSHPSLTPSALASYAGWRLTDLLLAAWNGTVSAVLDGVRLLSLDALLEALVAAPALSVGALLAYSVVCALSMRVLYKNLIGPRPARNHHARLSTS